ncbi:hypothetical protein [Cellulomonas terrae]|nr:hypothetical protein [Cellulomonas terrae]
MTSPHVLVVVDDQDVARIEAEGELWAPHLAELHTRMLALAAHGCRTIDLDLSRASPGFLAGELLAEVVRLPTTTCTVTVAGWARVAVEPEPVP